MRTFVLCAILIALVSALSLEDLIGKEMEPDYLYGAEGVLWKAMNEDESLSPIILIPGLSASGLDDKLTNADLPFTCPKNGDWERLWLQPSRIARVNCFVKQLSQTYDADTHTYHNIEGVEMRPSDFGGVQGVDYLGYTADGVPVNSTAYLAPLIANLEGAGYVVGQNLAAAPYDWRRDVNPGGDWNDNLQNLVETLYTNNENSPVFIVAHSMGNLEFSSFLETKDTAWKEQYIGGFISAAGPWSGASLTLRSIISGIAFKVGSISLPPDLISNLVRQFGSVVWMTPDELLLGSKDLVVTNNATYNYAQLGQLFDDLGSPVTRAIKENLVGALDIAAPGVPLYCLYGSNKETELWYEYLDGFNAQPTTIHYETGGDGVVPLQSLIHCLDMGPVSSRSFNLVGHGDLVKDPLFFLEIMEITSNGNDKQ